MPGPITITQYKDVSVSKDGDKLSGLISASYSLKRNFNTIFSTGQKIPIATYGVLPDIDVSYTSYSGGFDVAEANSFSTIGVSGAGGSVSVDYALLSNFSFEMSVDSFLQVTKTFRGFSKPAGGGGGGGGGASANPTVIKRQDFGGSVPGNISANHLQKVSGQVSIDRQFIGEFATRRPYASAVNFPIVSSITYEFFTDKMDSESIDTLQSACKNPSSSGGDFSISACGFSFSIKKAHLVSIEYSGAEASSPGSFQTMSVTYSSYEGYSDIEPVILTPI